MSNIIEFKAVKTRQKTHSKRNIVNPIKVVKTTVMGCQSPIGVTRPEEHVIAISFRLDCFDANILDNAVRLPCYGQNYWKLYRAERENRCHRSGYVTYLIELIGEVAGVTDDEALTQIIALITHEAYLREVSVWGSKVDVSELAVPYKVGQHDGFTIDRNTVQLLRKNGLQSALDVAKTTREELCMVSGMTTREVSRIEKSLASRGMFLDTAKVPPYKG